MSHRNLLLTLICAIILIATVGISVYLVQQNQELRRRADGSHKITICHVPPGNPENAHEIDIAKSAWENGHSPHNSHNMDFVVTSNRFCGEVITSSCLQVKTFDTNWNELSQQQLSQLQAGQIVRFAVAATTSSGQVDKAKFTINGTQHPETTTKKPGSDEFYVDFSIPTGLTNFTITAQLHHQQLNQWF